VASYRSKYAAAIAASLSEL
jgi:hypothetical protein